MSRESHIKHVHLAPNHSATAFAMLARWRRDARVDRMLVYILALLACIGCRPESESTPSGALWQISDQARVTLGASIDPDVEPLYVVRGSVLLSDGRIAVADGPYGRTRLTIFAPQGDSSAVLGGPGDGPGEFRLITSLQRGPGDSLYVFDAQSQRLTVMSQNGQVARTTRAATSGEVEAGAGLSVVGRVRRLADGTWAGRELNALVDAGPGEIRQDTVALGLLDDDLRMVSLLERLPGSTTTRISDGRFGRTAFSPQVLWAVWGRCVFMTTGASRSVSIYSAGGTRVTKFDGPGTSRSVAQEHLDTYLAYRLRDSPDPARYRQWMEEAAVPEYLPSYYQMVVDEWGQIWLQEFEPPLGRGTRWWLVSQRGVEVAEVRIPREIDVHSISKEGVLGRTLNESDEDRVELLPFSAKPSDTPAPLKECDAEA